MRTFVASLIVLGCSSLVPAQPDTIAHPSVENWTRYHGGFDFREGIYGDFHSFRNNAPTWPLAALTDDQGRAVRDIRSTVHFFHVDSMGEREEIDLDRAWGFCDNNIVYLRAGNGFFRIGRYGALAHLVFEKSYWGADPFGDPTSGSRYTVQEEVLLDMDAGTFLDLNAATLEIVLARDEGLKAEWDLIPKKKRKQEVLYLFLRRYNERHPLYFPP